MKIKLEMVELQTQKGMELIDITQEVERVVTESGVRDGIVNIMSKHTSTGIIVTEGIWCVEQDILDHLEKLAPEKGDYHHNRPLDFAGRLGFNAHAHLKSVLTGYTAFFPIQQGQLILGGAQRIYFAEYDGPLSRTYCVQVLGE